MGRNFIHEFRKIYGQGVARYVVPFFSREYLAGAYPRDEYNAAVTWSIELRDDVYILPLVVGDVKVPEELLSSAIGYLRAEDHTAQELAGITAERVRGVVSAVGRPSAPAAPTGILLPNIAPSTFSRYDTLENVLSLVSGRFQENAAHLTEYGYSCRVRTSGTSVDVRVEALGKQVYGLRVWLDDSFGSEQLAVAWGWPRVSGSGKNGWAAAEWDGKRKQAGLKYSDGSAGYLHGVLLTADEFFDLLWRKVVGYIEQRH